MGDTKREVNKKPNEDDRFIFKKKSQFVWINILISFHGNYVGGLFSHGSVMSTINVVNIVQSMIVSVFIFLPIMFLQLCIGHISQQSCPAIRKMAPIATGINYSMLIITYFEVIMCLMDLRHSIYYTIMSLSLPWMDCYKTTGICIGKKEMLNIYVSSQTFEQIWGTPFKIEYLSAVQYFREVLTADGHSTDYGDTLIRGVRVVRYISFLIVALAIYLTARVDFHKSIVAYSRMGMLIILVLILLFAFFVWEMESVYAVKEVAAASFELKTFAQSSVWVKVILSLFISCNMSNVSLVYFGSCLKPNTNNELLTLQTWILLMTFELFLCMITALMQGGLSHYLKVSPSKLTISSDEMLYTLYAVHLSMSSTGPGLLCACFFIFITIVVILRASAYLSLIYFTLCDMSVNLATYKHYIIACSALLTSSLAIPWINETFFAIYRESIHLAVFCSSIIILIIEAIVAFWIYGVHNLCDDYHFKLGCQPSLFWKINWWASPIVLTGSLTLVMLSYKAKLKGEALAIFLLIISIAYAVQIIVLLLTIFQFIKRKELTHLFLKEESWGDPDPEERKARSLYPPRLQVRYRRRVERCQHNCLCYITLLPQVVKREDEARSILHIDSSTDEHRGDFYSNSSDDMTD